MDTLEAYSKAREEFAKQAMLSSALALLAAGASRLPAWEVSSPVGWLVGTVNVGFLSVFGPILVFGAFCNVYLGLRELSDLRAAALGDSKDKHSAYAKAVLRPPRGTRRKSDSRFVIASWGLHIWNFWVPVLAYTILVSTYFDFVRPATDDSPNPRFGSRTEQIVDLLIGTGGWSGFRPNLPSIQANLADRQAEADKLVEVARLRQLARTVPWIYPPFQTWAYIGGLLLLIYMAWGAWRSAWAES
jgi:hypothetical protein